MSYIVGLLAAAIAIGALHSCGSGSTASRQQFAPACSREALHLGAGDFNAGKDRYSGGYGWDAYSQQWIQC